MVPAAWVLMKQLPLTPNGKLDRRALPIPEERSNEAGEYRAPRNMLERSLAEIWAQVLRIDRVGIRDNFFDLGGHSLSGITLVSMVSERFKVDLPVAAMFRYPTVRQMANAVESLRQRSYEGHTGETLEFQEGVI
jgi:acyl carrier protein